MISCNTQKHKVVETNIPLFSIIENHYIDVPVHKCLTCKRTFISEEMWRAYMKHGIDKAYYVQHETQFDQFKQHSELNSYGYTVGKTGLSIVERQVLIINLLKTGKMQAYEIERDIINAIKIHQNNPKMHDALFDWQDDLKFLGDYTLKNIRKK